MPFNPAESPPLEPKKVFDDIKDDEELKMLDDEYDSGDEQEQNKPFGAPNRAAARRVNAPSPQDRLHHGATGSNARSENRRGKRL
ncbi:hypothetical protein BDV25DRAFT_142336 [Aspergillus avenaceus]|uniref:Uncharacterized protein n=1 Tax=Aspergillus avenaceus TaxID=36643 RepID=A0A5N6TNC6_ASPAV|nr:hypothetical protein BDV25DRAFT_142336 [Aspergillus avenaceus]